MADLSKNIIALTTPTIEKDELPAIDDPTVEKLAGKYFPYILINKFEFTADNLVSFELLNNNSIPTLTVVLLDNTTNFMSRFFPKDGDVLSFIIRSNNEDVFKPIRIDFDILYVTPITSLKNKYVPTKFIIGAQMKIPTILGEYCESFQKKSSWDTLSDLSDKLKLGFASNEEDTNDIMTWINPYDTRLKFINDVVSNAYLDDNSFFDWFIDPYYMLNFINMNKLFVAEADVLKSETYMINNPDLFIKEDTKNNLDSPMILTNLGSYSGTSKYLANFQMFNNSGKIFLKNGYKRYVQFFDQTEQTFINEYINPLNTEGLDDYIHLRGRYKDNKYEDLTDSYVKYKYMGSQNSSENGNVHENYLFANVLNFQNKQEIFKMGMKVQLDIADMSIYRYQVIPVFIYNNEEISKQIQNQNEELDAKPKLNEFLSGSYIIYDIKYLYKFPGPIQQELTLIKREYKSPI